MRSLSRAVVFVLTTVAAMFAPSVGTAAESDVWAFLHADQPTVKFYEPARQAAGSPGVRAEVARTGTGSYLVRLRGASSAGVPMVTAVNRAAVHCQVARFAPAGSAEEIRVECYAGTTRADSRFTLSYFASSKSDSGAVGAYGYVFNDQPLLPVHTTAPSHNSAGGPVEIYLDQRTGTWTVRFFGQAFNNIAGNAQVTALGGQPVRCAIVEWYPHALGVDARVRCDKLVPLAGFSPQWTLVYVHERSIVGARSGQFAYLQADQPGASSYVPSQPRNLGSDGFVHSVTRSGAGRYQAQLYGTFKGPDTLQLVVNGDTSDFCNVAGWTPQPGSQPGGLVDVACYTSAGVPKDNWFSFNYFASP
ncbi:hypothetical protein ACSHWB_39695 [Lentzea sp. HUAS TT2]|uniref:hypothetical protein n=1 Tax=Lentzea sp. HUAS TT2 TaxID=3447454 RepID=UPI003F72DED0